MVHSRSFPPADCSPPPPLPGFPLHPFGKCLLEPSHHIGLYLLCFTLHDELSRKWNESISYHFVGWHRCTRIFHATLADLSHQRQDPLFGSQFIAEYDLIIFVMIIHLPISFTLQASGCVPVLRGIRDQIDSVGERHKV